MTTTSTSMPVSLPKSGSARQVSGPREAEQAVAGDARGDRQQQELAERLLQHLVQRHVQAPGLVGFVGVGGVAEQAADDRDRNALGHVAGLAEPDVRLADVAA